MVTKGLLLAVDANSLLHRAYHAYPLTLTTTDNQPVNAVFGFASMLLDALLFYKPEYVFCAFDTNKPTFRHTAYTEYKANRPKTDSELVLQLPYVYEVLKALNIPVFAVSGYEADDILGTVCAKLSTERFHGISQSYVLTGDRDLFQLVNEHVQVVMPKGSFRNLELYNEENVLTRMGVSPAHITDLKGLMGDASDNIPGVKGIGPKTASELLTKYHSLEEIYEHLEDIQKDNKRVAQLLTDGQKSAVMSKELATIAKDTPVTFTAEDAETKVFDAREVMRLFSRFQFKSLFPRLNRLISVTGNEPVPFEEEKAPVELEEIDTSKLGELVASNIMQESFLGKSLSERVAFFNSLQLKDTPVLAIYHNERVYYTQFKPKETIVEGISLYFFGSYPFFANTASNSEENVTAAEFSKVLDIELLSYALHTGRDDYTLQVDLLQSGAGTLSDELDKAPEKVMQLALRRILVELEQAQKYVPLERITDLWKTLKNDVSGEQIPVKIARYEDLPATFGVSLMHHRGISINKEYIVTVAASFREKILKIEKDIVDLVGFEFNVRSTKQLANVLFGNLGLPNAKKTKTGFSTDDEVLQGLLGTHPVIEKILEHRQLAKLVSTYMEPYLEIKEVKSSQSEQSSMQQSLFDIAAPVVESVPHDTRIHSTFAVTGTSSGRLSSTNPNLQNLPVKTEIGKVIRQFFVPEKGKKLLSIDYSQIDLRVLAHISGDKSLIEAFQQGQDIHRSTAAKIFHVPFAEVSDKQRRFAKSINFGLIYGMSSYGLSKSIGVEVSEAAKFIADYFEHFPQVKQYMVDTIEFAREHGYVLSLLGRRRFTPGITTNNKMRAQASEREAINMPIQGGADDIMRLALGQVSQLPEILSGQVKLVLQIHDEFVFELLDDSEFIENVIRKIDNIMMSVVKLKVPLLVDSAVGDTLDM
jgi:DNA polymerase-1